VLRAMAGGAPFTAARVTLEAGGGFSAGVE